MITNATLLAITAPGTPNGNGGYTPGVETSFNGVRCCVDVPSHGEIAALAGRVADVKAVLYVPMPLPGGYSPQAGGDVRYHVSGGVEATMRIGLIQPLTHGGLSHYQCFLQRR